MRLQESGEMYLETIFVLTKENPSVRSIDICEHMGFSKPSVSRAVGLLKNGGYITVKADGSVVCYHLYNRTEFEKYLFDYTAFDRPSTSKYNYMTIYKEAGQYKIKLCLQIRFK